MSLVKLNPLQEDMTIEILGIDIGGSGIKGAPVDIEHGKLLVPRYRIPTPKSAKPGPMAETIAKIARHFDWKAPVGCGYPGVVREGVTMSAANVHKDWIGLDARTLLSETSGCQTYLINDADAAGLAEMNFGAGRGQNGVVLVITIGTGLGTALFVNQKLVPNTEFGHIEIECFDAETRASDAARKRDQLSWKRWASRFNLYLQKLEQLLSPDLIILGGGASKKHERFMPLLTVKARMLPAELLNDAGIIGAALAAGTFLNEDDHIVGIG
jgi:polyphosphate glucokinase